MKFEVRCTIMYTNEGYLTWRIWFLTETLNNFIDNLVSGLNEYSRA